MAKKIVVPPVENTETDINTFSDKLNQILNNVEIVDNGDGTESVELNLDERIITFIIDQSGSMTWNDNGGFRHQIARKILEDVEANYPGEIRYNLFQYGAIISSVLFFGIIEQDGFNPNDIDSLNALYFADDEANFAGIRVVRNVERIVDGNTLTYPTSPIDGEIVSEGYISKAFNDELIEGTTYYYTVYTFDKQSRFSQGRNVKAIPRDRVIPKGVTIFEGFNKDGEESTSMIGSAVQRDENTIGLWHMDEVEGYRLFDFSDTKANLTLFDTEPSWVGEKFVPAGEGGMYFNGLNDYAYVNGVSDLWRDLTASQSEITTMAWILPYNISDTQTIISSVNGEQFAYRLYMDAGLLRFEFQGNAWRAPSVPLEVNKWQHVCATYSFSTGTCKFYINGVDVPSNAVGGSAGAVDGSYYYSIGVSKRTSGLSDFFYGKITEISVHDTIRDITYIQNQVSIEPVIDPITKEQYTDPITGLPVTEEVGLKGDNGDRLNIFKYTVPEDADYLGGNVIIVRNEKNAPTWEENGTTIFTDSTVIAGDFLATDVDDFVLGGTYYYRIYSQNTLGNFSYSSDSPSLSLEIPTGVLTEYIPELVGDLEGPAEAFGAPTTVGGNKKVGIRWRNDLLTDDRIKRVKIYFSTTNFPTVNPDGGSSGTLIFTGDTNDTSFVHRYLSNSVERFYTITNIDKYGRNSSTQVTSSATTNVDATDEEESLIPLLEVEDLHYEIVTNESTSIIWEQPIKHPEDLESFFGQTALLYATITDEFGQPIPDESIVEMVIDSNISRETTVDDVFRSGDPVEFEDEEAYSFVASGIKNGVIQASLAMSTDADILSQITEAEFTIKVKSYIPSNSTNQGETASDGQATSGVGVSGPIGDYLDIINDLIEDIEGDDDAATVSTSNIFEYISQPITISFSNPWDLEIVNRDDKFISERCYYYKPDPDRGVSVLTQMTESLPGAYIRSSNPFVARVKVTYKGEPISSGTVDLAIWDADVDLCSCARDQVPTDCEPNFEKTNISEIITLPSYRVPIVTGTETTTNSRGETIVAPISYVDVSLYAPDLPLNIKLYAKGTFAGFSSLKDFNVVFQNILRIDLNAQAPQADGVNVIEQQSTVYIINPDFPNNPDLYTYPVDQSIVEWGLEPKHAFETEDIGGGLLESITSVDIIPRNLYSVDNVPISNGVFSYTRTGTARNVFIGPAENREANIEETYELSATISYEGFSDQARQEITIDHTGASLQPFGARFLMETEYSYRSAKSNKIWTDGIDYKKLYISRDPTTAEYPDFLFGSLFRTCAGEEDSPVLELNPSGQVVTLNSSDDVEFVWGDVTEAIDPYTGRDYLITTDDTFSSFGSADVELNDEDVSDKTVVYFRINSFTHGSNCNKNVIPPCEDINLLCLDLTTCDFPLGNISISGETFIFVNGEPLKLLGGGGDSTGVPPCPICFNEPLRVSTVWTKIDGVDTDVLGDFPDDAITVNSYMDIRVEVSFAELPVPDGTPIVVIAGNNDGQTVFGAFKNIVFTEINDTDVIDEYTGEIISEADGKSYADIRIIILHVPDVTSTELIKVFSTYNERGITERSVGQEYSMTLEITDVVDDTEEEEPEEVTPEEEETVYSKTLERYDIDNNEWSYSTNMSIARSAPFVGSVDNHIYVFGGFIDNDLFITSITEVYDALNDSWSFALDMPTPRFGGQSVTVGDKIYTIGGCFYDSKNQNNEVSRAVEVYDTIAEEWEVLEDMPSVGVGLSEEFYGIAYGYAVHVVHSTGSDIFNYIYVLSGATVVDDGSNGIQIEVLNDRILRYCIEEDNWEITSSRLFGVNLDTYQRISPLGFLDSGEITIFNGAIVDLDTTVNEFLFTNEIYTITVTDDIDFTQFVPVILIGTKPLAKYQSALVNYTTDLDFEPSGSIIENFLFVLGGSNDDSFNLDLVERLDPSTIPYEYTNSEITLTSMEKGRNAFGAAFAYGIDDEYGAISPYIYVFGGKTSGVADGGIDIGF